MTKEAKNNSRNTESPLKQTFLVIPCKPNLNELRPDWSSVWHASFGTNEILGNFARCCFSPPTDNVNRRFTLSFDCLVVELAGVLRYPLTRRLEFRCSPKNNSTTMNQTEGSTTESKTGPVSVFTEAQFVGVLSSCCFWLRLTLFHLAMSQTKTCHVADVLRCLCSGY